MCGILGSINKKLDNDLLNLIKHRGPDRQDLWQEVCAGHQVWMGHTRLSIVDLSEAGNQPMSCDEGMYTLIFNGEIYNHEDLRKEISFKDYRGHSDTETLLHGLIEHGVDFIRKMNGIFAFAFLDKMNQQIILARDPFGVKPLYFSKKGKEFVFSSEIRPIQKLVHSGIDEQALQILLNLRHVPSPYTLFKDVRKLRPGHYAIIDMKREEPLMTIMPFIDKVPHQQVIQFEKAVDDYGYMVEKAVNRQLMSDVEVGILLSGGVDSALVAGIASKNVNYKMKAFTVGFDSKYAVNEIGWAKETADCFGLEHHVVKMQAENFFDIFAECSCIVEEPLGADSLIPMFYLSKLASQYVKVVLTGQGADEPLGGYNRYQGEILRQQYPSFLFKMIHWGLPLLHSKRETLIRGAQSLAINDDVKRFVSSYSIFTDNEIEKLTGREIRGLSTDLYYYYYNLVTNDCQDAVSKNMTIDQHIDLADNLLAYTDKITMNFALECRVPMLDHELVYYIEQLPTEFKIKKHQGKIIHKAFAQKYLPEKIVNRPKLGFRSPTDIWFRENFEQIKGMLEQGEIVNYLSKDAIDKILLQHLNGYNRQKQIFVLLGINEWLKRL